MSEHVKWIMHERNVAVSQTTPYKTQCNRLTERYNSIFHKAIQAATTNCKWPLTFCLQDFGCYLNIISPNAIIIQQYTKDSFHLKSKAHLESHFHHGLQILLLLLTIASMTPYVSGIELVVANSHSVIPMRSNQIPPLRYLAFTRDMMARVEGFDLLIL